MKRKLAFTRLVKPFARIWTRAKAYWLGCTRNPRKPSFASAHSYGFTLAEVLITLTILGVVAAIAVPNLIRNYEKRANITKIQKAYSQIINGFSTTMAEAGCNTIACTLKANGFDLLIGYDANRSSLIPKYMNIFLPGITAEDGHGISPRMTVYSLNGTAITNTSDLGRTTKIYTYTNWKQMKILISDECFSTYGHNTKGTGKGCDLYVITDGGKTDKERKNAKKATLGKNTFAMHLKDNGDIIPIEGPCDSSLNSTIASGYEINGMGCLNKLMKNNWKMNY